MKDAIEGVIVTQARTPGGGLIVLPDAFNRTNRDLIIALSAGYGVPAIYDDRPYAESGGLMTYGADRSTEFRQAASYVDRILKGEKPADLPIRHQRNSRWSSISRPPMLSAWTCRRYSNGAPTK